MNPDEARSRRELEIEVAAEISVVRSSETEGGLVGTPAQWLFDPTDVEREEIGLGSILGAVEALERTSDPDPS